MAALLVKQVRNHIIIQFVLTFLKIFLVDNPYHTTVKATNLCESSAGHVNLYHNIIHFFAPYIAMRKR